MSLPVYDDDMGLLVRITWPKMPSNGKSLSIACIECDRVGLFRTYRINGEMERASRATSEIRYLSLPRLIRHLKTEVPPFSAMLVDI